MQGVVQVTEGSGRSKRYTCTCMMCFDEATTKSKAFCAQIVKNEVGPPAVQNASPEAIRTSLMLHVYDHAVPAVVTATS